MYTFHAIDTATGKLFDMAHLNSDELDGFMLEAEAKYWACQVVQGITGKVVRFEIAENGQWEAVKKANIR